MTMGKDVMTNTVVIPLASTDQLFNAPPINPFSEREIELLGEPGLDYLIRQLQAHRHDRQRTRLLVLLPPDQITPEVETRLGGAIRRYCRTKIADNLLKVHLIRVRTSRGLGIAVAIVAAVILIAYFLFDIAFADVAPVIQVIVAAVITLFAWVTLWDVLEALLFNPLPLLRENTTLREIADAEIAVQPDTRPIETGVADAANA